MVDEIVAKFVRPPTAQAAVLTELRRAIVHGEMEPGSAIPQEAIAERFGVSRVPVREALKILEGEGRVLYQPNRGYTVSRLDAEELLGIYRLRKLLESYAVTLGVPRLTKEVTSRMDAFLVEMDAFAEEGNINRLTDANRGFHFSLFEASGEKRLVKMIRGLWDSSDPYRSIYFVGEGNRHAVQDEHRGIMEAVKRRDTDSLIDQLDQHRDRAQKVLQELLQSSQTEPN